MLDATPCHDPHLLVNCLFKVIRHDHGALLIFPSTFNPLSTTTWPVCLCVHPSSGDVFLLQTRDRKNPLVYTVFSTSRSESIHTVFLSVPVCAYACLGTYVCVHPSALSPAAVCLKAQLCVSTPWMTSGGPSWGPLLTKRGPTTSGSRSREKFPIPAQEWYVASQDTSSLFISQVFIWVHSRVVPMHLSPFNIIVHYILNQYTSI